MARSEHLPIYKKSLDLLIYFERLVSNFSRYHKYSIGRDLRDVTRLVLRLAVRATDSADKRPVLEKIRIHLEALLISAGPWDRRWISRQL